jgi:hypothetical protein
MSIRTAQHRLTTLAAFAALGISHIIQPAFADDPPRTAPAASAPKLARPVNATRKLNDTPLRFDPPSAGPHGPTRAAYEYCIEHPSPDGLYTDCSALLPNDPPGPKAAARPAKPR